MNTSQRTPLGDAAAASPHMRARAATMIPAQASMSRDGSVLTPSDIGQTHTMRPTDPPGVSIIATTSDSTTHGSGLIKISILILYDLVGMRADTYQHNY